MEVLKTILIVLISSSISVRADDVYELKKGEAAPIDGTLLSVDKSKEVKNRLIEGEAQKELNTSLKKSLELEKQNTDYANEKLKLYATQNNELASSLHNERTTSNWVKFAYFAGGAAATILVLYGVQKVSR
jgi:magnesium-transporting ATPase (P-type)